MTRNEIDAQRTSPLARLEACAVLATRLDNAPAQAEDLFESLLADADLGVDPITDAVGKLAVECVSTYGKGRHPARLDIVVSEQARTTGSPIRRPRRRPARCRPCQIL